MLKLPRTRWLVILGLVLFIFGETLPIRLPIWSGSETHDVGPLNSSSESVDIPFSLIYGESVVVDVVFEDAAIAEDCWVWGSVSYQYPTKYVSETSIRIEGQRQVHLTIGWGDVRLIPIFVTGFEVRIFYLGGMPVEVNVTITRVANIISFTGLGFLIACFVIIVVPVITSRVRKGPLLSVQNGSNV